MANPADTQITWRVARDSSSAWSSRLRQRLATETQTFLDNVLTTAQATVRVRTGATQESGEVEQIDETSFRVKFGGAALYLEFGTRKMPAYPFLRPAVVENQAEYLRRLAITTQGRVRGPIGHLADLEYR